MRSSDTVRSTATLSLQLGRVPEESIWNTNKERKHDDVEEQVLYPDASGSKLHTSPGAIATQDMTR